MPSAVLKLLAMEGMNGRILAASLLAVFLAAHSWTLQAQSTARDGVQAMLRGEYQDAVRILRPLAEDPAQPDPIAQFFLAMMYDSWGRCRLLIAASSRPSPIAGLALDGTRAMEELDAGIWHFCFDSQAPPPSLRLPERFSPTSAGPGVDAFLSGDYARAADILKPLAERPPGIDGVAAYFLAAMYEGGLGVPADNVRACALSLRAMAHPSVFAAQADGRLLMTYQRLLGREGFEECRKRSTEGFDTRLERATFSLEPGQWITWDEKGATVTYDGKEKFFDAVASQPFGARFLPVRHTELASGPTRQAQRHVMELSFWTPDKTAQAWVLNWSLFEVVRDELVTVTFAPLITVTGPAPPETIDIRDLVALQVNTEGDAEWVRAGGPAPHAGRIETDEERQAMREEQRVLREQERTRAAADARVDWQAVRDVYRSPSLSYSDSDGCSGIQVYGWSSDRTEAIYVMANRTLLQLSTTPRTFDVASTPNGLQVAVHVRERPMGRWNFCTDVIEPESPKEVWRAVRGTVTIRLSAIPDARSLVLPRATVQITNAEFVSPTGAQAKQTQPIVLSGRVGVFPGG